MYSRFNKIFKNPEKLPGHHPVHSGRGRKEFIFMCQMMRFSNLFPVNLKEPHLSILRYEPEC